MVDLHTIEHTYTKAGKEITVHYTLPQINARVNQYEREVADAEEKELGEDIVENRKSWLAYWKSRRQELLAKVE